MYTNIGLSQPVVAVACCGRVIQSANVSSYSYPLQWPDSQQALGNDTDRGRRQGEMGKRPDTDEREKFPLNDTGRLLNSQSWHLQCSSNPLTSPCLACVQTPLYGCV